MIKMDKNTNECCVKSKVQGIIDNPNSEQYYTILDEKTLDSWCPAIEKMWLPENGWKKPDKEEHIKKMRDGIVEREISLYIHIPFCKSTCSFCPFTRIQITNDEQETLIPKYINALLNEIDVYSQIIEGQEFKIIDTRAGGGTPSLLNGKQWKIILDYMAQKLGSKPKISIEAHPTDLKDESYVFDLVDSGVHEVSLGVQSFNPKTLKSLGRMYPPEDSFKSIENLQNAGCKRINIDLMYMVPGQTLQEYINDLEIASSLDIEEISFYPMLVYSNSAKYEFLKNNKISQPDKKTFENMTYTTHDILSKKGFRMIEIPAYTRNGWKYPTNNFGMDKVLFGLGCGAWGFSRNYKYFNTFSVPEYINKIKNRMLPVDRSKHVSMYEHAKAYTNFNLFLRGELDKSIFQQKFSCDFDKVIEGTEIGKLLESLEQLDYIKEYNKKIKVSKKGLFMASIILWRSMLSHIHLYVC